MSYIYPSVSQGKTTFKVYFVYNNQKIYLGTYPTEEAALAILAEAEDIMQALPGTINFTPYTLNYKKVICLCNFRDHNKYIKNPIYIHQTYFHYYLTKSCILVFDNKDLLYFSTYKIYKRGNYLYTQDSISQKNILSRFGIPNHSVPGKDYIFKNNNPYDFRQSNLEIINSYKGVTKKVQNNSCIYVTSIYTDTNIVVGHYHTEAEAAIAYNKAIDLLYKQGNNKEYIYNVIPFITQDEYNKIYNTLFISPRITHLEHQRKRIISTKTLRGVTKDHASYKVHIGYNGKQYYLGMYPTEKRAAQAYNYASFYLFGMKGYINDVSPLIEDRDINKIVGFLSKYGILKEATS